MKKHSHWFKTGTGARTHYFLLYQSHSLYQPRSLSRVVWIRPNHFDEFSYNDFHVVKPKETYCFRLRFRPVMLCSVRKKVNLKAQFFFDVCRLFLFIFFAFAPTFSWYELTITLTFMETKYSKWDFMSPWTVLAEPDAVAGPTEQFSSRHQVTVVRCFILQAWRIPDKRLQCSADTNNLE